MVRTWCCPRALLVMGIGLNGDVKGSSTRTQDNDCEMMPTVLWGSPLLEFMEMQDYKRIDVEITGADDRRIRGCPPPAVGTDNRTCDSIKWWSVQAITTPNWDNALATTGVLRLAIRTHGLPGRLERRPCQTVAGPLVGNPENKTT